MFLTLDMMTNQVLEVGGHLLSLNQQAHFGIQSKVAFSNWHNLCFVHACMKSCGNLISITVHVAPNVEFLVRMFIILMSLHPVQVMA
jgi:hypothetical protein